MEASLIFTFQDEHQAASACDTLLELGYRANRIDHQGAAGVSIQISRDDLTSALEITQAHGGILEESPHPAADIYSAAYRMEHTYESVQSQADDAAVQDEDEPYDHFSAGIHL